MSNNHKLPTVCIVGRTNVGKSTLFNALVGRRKAVVRDQPGVTRDRCYELVTRFNFVFNIIDTGALVGEETIALHESVRAQSELAMKQSDVIVVVFDGLHGLHPLDSDVVEVVRQAGKPTVFVANKCEKPSAALTATELYGLGIEEIIPISAAHRRGIRDLIAALERIIQPENTNSDFQGENNEEEIEEFDPTSDNENNGIEDIPEESQATPVVEESGKIHLAVIGKPNVGKSTFVNSLLGEERMITSPIAGTTRDSISSTLIRNGKEYEIVDTAGLPKKAGVADDTVERFSNIRTLRSLAQCDVAVFLLDASEGAPTEQDARIVGLAHEKGKSLVIVVNKWDLIEKHPTAAEAYRRAIRAVFKFAAYAPVLFVSAKTGLRCLKTLDLVREVHDAAGKRLSTAEVNRIFGDAFSQKPPPVWRGSPIKPLYATQVATKPPTFAVFVNHPDRLRFNYERYLKNSMRKFHEFPGSDVRILFRRRSGITNDRRRAA